MDISTSLPGAYSSVWVWVLASLGLVEQSVCVWVCMCVCLGVHHFTQCGSVWGTTLCCTSTWWYLPDDEWAGSALWVSFAFLAFSFKCRHPTSWFLCHVGNQFWQ